MSNLENNNKLNAVTPEKINGLTKMSDKEEAMTVGGLGVKDVWNGLKSLVRPGEKTAEGETQNQLAEGASETTQDGATVLANTGAPTTAVPTGTETVVTPATPATVEQSLTGETQQSFSSGAGTNRGRKNRRSL